MIDVDCWNAVAQAFSVIDHTKRPHERSGDAFGELHVLLFGDFKQLPPATSKPPFIMLDTVYNTFDFALYSEGFTQVATNKDKGKDNPKGFISIETLIRTKTLDPTLQSIADFVTYPLH